MKKLPDWKLQGFATEAAWQENQLITEQIICRFWDEQLLKFRQTFAPVCTDGSDGHLDFRQLATKLVAMLTAERDRSLAAAADPEAIERERARSEKFDATMARERARLRAHAKPKP